MPEEIEHLGNSTEIEILHLWLERVAELLDKPGNNPNFWLLLRKVIIQVMKLDSKEMKKEIYNSVFDEFRIKAWSKMHFDSSSNFSESLFTKMFPNSEISGEYKIKFDQMASNTTEMCQENSIKESKLEVSKKYCKHHVNYHEMIYQAVDLRRDIGQFHLFTEPILKFHVILKFLEDRYLFPPNENTNSVKHRFMNVNLDLAKQVMLNKNDENVDKILSLLEQERQESIVGYIYQSDSKIILRQSLQFLKEICPKKKFRQEELSEILLKIVTHRLSSMDSRLKKANLTQFDISRFNRLLKRYVDFTDFENTLRVLFQDLQFQCENWGIDEDCLRKVLENLRILVHRPIPIKYAIKSVLNRQHNQVQDIQEFLNHSFQHLLFE